MGKNNLKINAADLLENVVDGQGLIDVVNKMMGDFQSENNGECPTQLRIPDNHWHLLEMLVHENFDRLVKPTATDVERRDEMIKKGFDGSGITFFGLKIYGTIRVPHVK